MLMLALLALAAAEPPPALADDPSTSLAELQQMYDQSCAAREYGAYDDLCDQLSHQLRDARVEADREARRKAADARRHPREPVAPPPLTPVAPPGPSASPAPSGAGLPPSTPER